jgi:centrosomal protein CEP41
MTSNLTSVTIKTEQLPVGVDTDFLLIDLRDPEDYENYHIREALNFPGVRIKTDKFIPQLYGYKNKEGKIIVLYHFDEKPGIDYATQLFEKGYDNILLLNAGIEGFGQEIPEGLEGKSVPHFQKKE